ncbi:Ketosteroid isomerase-related protein [Amycolatopsis arida]|uniref:Ketosteroid isomerase-related protein n=1 Tax=Amycolatopsis arida TaxID=587909 RepID=A0A1I5V3Z8_9PSEU|nr:nuclear transport factor 2 family protein [Amycolatopsis arida]TDX91140.1 ketosteroid isomerase-like protein [Amycolatopsis arida]SFQ02180.1 Ketosteroid isomerase-related protein [Amycolatopsis arida]
MPQLDERTDGEAADIVARFTEAWSTMDPDAFTPLLHPDVRLVHPMEANTRGIDEAHQFMRRIMTLIPDLRFEVHGWASGSGQVLIWGRLHGTLGGGPIEWPLVDRITPKDGLIAERVAYFDPLVIVTTLLRRPRAWPSYLAMRWRGLRGGRAGSSGGRT